MTIPNIHVQTRWGASDDAPSPERLRELVAELYCQDEEHAGAWMVDRNSDWSLRFDEDRFAYLEYGEDDAIAHLPRVSETLALTLWRQFAEGGHTAVAGFNWREGPRTFTEQEVFERHERARTALLAGDRVYYDRLGPELPETACRAPGCTRGRIQYSVFCRVHHFEQLFKRPCPFAD